ncbi:MAG: ATP-binding cassette domain-containing protein [Ectothiorhodospiraceae bacterium]|nr:ATP-binding cassette domain-containing protein [Chromatiales bacterium]MCP5154938.1 ATP-binding cassette domain-containing protein [Ectothiorhodospiraceae bacterium]
MTESHPDPVPAERTGGSARPDLLQVEHLQVHFPIRGKGLFARQRGQVRAVDDVSFAVRRGETLGLVGESGSGKTTVGRAILRAVPVTAGRVRFRGDQGEVDLLGLEGESLRRFRKHMQLIFQDPYASLNPRMTVRDIIAEPLEAGAQKMAKSEIDDRVRETARRCRLNLEHLRRFPHAFSGGQRQRIGIARALVSSPEFVVCDESVSALDVSIQADILNLLMDLQEELHTTYLFIAHDLSVVAQISTRVAVMYVGKLMELAPTDALFSRPAHPYTNALFSAIPHLDPTQAFEPLRLTGEIPNPASPPPGCRFQTRCPFAEDRCRNEEPAWREVGPDHLVACHFAERLDFTRRP